MGNKLKWRVKKWRMRQRVKKAFAPYYQGEKSFVECQSDALIALLGNPIEEIKK